MKKTAGQVALELSQKSPELVPVMEAITESFEDYAKKVEDQVEKALKKYDGDFFIVTLQKMEEALTTASGRPFIRRFIADAGCCPTPFYDQTVYKYTRLAGALDLVWTIPDPETCVYLENNASRIPTEEYQLLDFVLKYRNGDLLRVAKKLNNESDDAPSIIMERL